MKKNIILLSAAVIALSLALAGCGNSGESTAQVEGTAQTEGETSTDSSSNTVDATDTGIDESVLQAAEEARNAHDEKLIQLEPPQEGDTVATLHTSMGDISVRLFPQYTPMAVENFVTHAKDGYYNGVIFHRVINNFMIQSGDPEGTGAGGDSIWGSNFKNEVTANLRNFRGALCMANAGGQDTNGSQFYIVQNPDIGDDFKSQLEQIRTRQDEPFSDNPALADITFGDIFPEAVIDEYIKNGGYPSLDMGYTVFGQVYEGMDVVDKIAAVETNEDDRPLEDVVINSIDVSTYSSAGGQ